MNLAELSIRKSVITWVMTILFIVVGWISFNSLSRLEDPEFTIKEATIITPYPGASAAEVYRESLPGAGTAVVYRIAILSRHLADQGCYQDGVR
jgi:hypothetical protein